MRQPPPFFVRTVGMRDISAVLFIQYTELMICIYISAPGHVIILTKY